MAQSLLKAAFLAGFLMLWLGYAFVILPIIFRLLFGGTWWNSLSLPYTERLRRASLFWSDAFQNMGTSRWHRSGQILLASGVSVLMLTGTAWLVLRIVER